jgi:hypothetical protein
MQLLYRYSKVRYLLGRGPEKLPFADAPPPMQALSAAEAGERFFGNGSNGRDALVACLLAMMAPHARHGDAAVAHAELVSEAESIGLEVCGSRRRRSPSPGSDDGGGVDEDEDEDEDDDDEKHYVYTPATRSLKSGLLWLRDRLAAMEPTPGARWGHCTIRIQLTHSLKPPGFKP